MAQRKNRSGQPALFETGPAAEADPSISSEGVEETKSGSHRKKASANKTGSDDSSKKYAWTLLYEARLARIQTESISVPSGNPRGRPARAVPLKRLTLRMTAGDEDTIKEWQKILTKIFGKQPSLGETSAIVAKILLERYQALSADSIDFKDLSGLVNFLVTNADARKEG
jgi:hypothetical protein